MSSFCLSIRARDKIITNMQDHEDSDESDTDSRDSFSDHSKNMLSLRTTAEELGFDE